jgi:cell division GTPase FtsZ
MSAISITEEEKNDSIEDDISGQEVVVKEEKPQEKSIDTDKLAALKAKSQKKQEEQEMASKIVSKKERSLSLGIIGSGQAGANLAAEFYNSGYNAVVLNTAIQDLKYVQIPDSNKLLLEYGLGGASKELEIGKAAAETHRDEIVELINNTLSDCLVNV